MKDATNTNPIRPERLDWDGIKTFHALAQNRSVRAAASALGIHHSTVSRRIDTLELQLNARLFDRQPEGFVLTLAGERLRTAAAAIDSQLVEVQRELAGTDNDLSGRLLVTMAEPLLTLLFAPRLNEFAAAYPNLELGLLPTMNLLDVSRREADIAIRMDNNPPETLIGRRLFPYAKAAYANPAYLEAIQFDDDPSAARWLGWQVTDGPHPAWVAETEFPELPCWGAFPEPASQLAAARAGLGLTEHACFMADRDPQLVRVGRRPPQPARDIWILSHTDLRGTARVRAFTDFADRIIRDAEGPLTGQL